MLRTQITKKNACFLVTVLAVMVALLTIWPLRLYQEDYVLQGNGEIQQVTDPVDADYDAGDYFVAQYDHLEKLAVYVASIEAGEAEPVELHFQLFLSEDGVNTLKAEEYVDLEPDALPGYVEILTDCDLEPGKTYVYLVRGNEGSAFRVGLESLEVASDPTAPSYTVGFYHDTTIDGLAVATRLTYREPLGRDHSLLLAVAVFLTGVVFILGFFQYYGKHPDRNHQTTLDAVLKYTLTPLVAAAGIFFLVTIWQQRFDERLSDNILYTIGVLLTLLVIFFGLWHDRSGLPDMMNRKILSRNWLHYVISLCIALILACCTTYMNATYEALHQQAMLRICILLAIIAVCMMPGTRKHGTKAHGSGKRRLRLWLVLPLAALAVFMLLFANGRSWIPIMVAAYLVLYLRFLFWKDRDQWLADLSRGILLHFAGAVIFSQLHRYYFAFIYSRFPMQYHTVTVTAYYLLIVGAAATAQLVAKYRQITDGGKHRFWWYADRLWKEAAVFGCVCAYMMMSLSRAGVFELALFLILAVVLAGKEKTRAGKYHLRTALGTLGWMVLSVILMFPAVFTNQRLISTVNARPVWYEEVEPYPDEVVRHVAWDDKWFMSWEVFLRDFGDRVIGGEVGSRIYEHFDWGEHQKVERAEDWVVNQIARTDAKQEIAEKHEAGKGGKGAEKVFRDSFSLYAMSAKDPQMNAADAAATERPGQAMTIHTFKAGEAREVVAAAGTTAAYMSALSSSDVSPGTLETGDYSNGRLVVWRAYLVQLNLTGHDTMGATLPDGSVAVHAHNNILQLAYDCGIPTGLLFLLVQVLIIVASGIYYRTAPLREQQSGGALMQLLLVIGFTITGMVEWTWTFCNPFCLMYMLCIAPLLERDRARL